MTIETSTAPLVRAETHDAIHRFVARLYAFAAAEDRGALAALRRSLQDPNGMAASAFPHVVPFLPKEQSPLRDRAYFLVAALFAQATTHELGVSIGDAFRRIQAASGAADGKDNPSIRSRFVALLDAHPEDVADHLRHALSLARAKDVAIDWEQLLRDILRLGYADRPVQRRWAQDFWGRADVQEDQTESTQLQTAAQGDSP
jgi:CRISPR system Cascade subunit CasB